MELVVHLMTEAAHQAWPRDVDLGPPSLSQEGFVHLCFPSQVEAVRARFFAQVPVVAVVLDAAQLGSPLVVEDSYGHGAYPHLYGPIPASAVVRTFVVKPGEPCVIAAE